MAENFAVVVEGLSTLGEFGDIAESVQKAAVLAINRTARDQRVRIARLIQSEIALPASYLREGGSDNSRLAVTQKAQGGRLEAKITARGRPTSLARYVRNPGVKRGTPLRLQVSPGRTNILNRAFLIRLPQGSTLTDTQFNLGLAIRLRPGERIENKTRQVRLARNLYLLYGPSVQQAFLNAQGGGVAAETADETLAKLEAEFSRQFDRLVK